MPKITEYTNEFGTELISVIYDDGSAWSGLRSAYDAMQAEQSTPIVTEE
jgi:hypothetical protein